MNPLKQKNVMRIVIQGRMNYNRKKKIQITRFFKRKKTRSVHRSACFRAREGQNGRSVHKAGGFRVREGGKGRYRAVAEFGKLQYLCKL